MTRLLTVTVTVTVTAAALAACGSAHPAASRPQTCRQQWRAWTHGPVRPAFASLYRTLGHVGTAVQATDIPAEFSGLKRAGQEAKRLGRMARAPSCVDTAGDWRKILVAVAAAGDDAGAEKTLGAEGAAEAAMSALQPVGGLVKALAAERKDVLG